MLPSFGISSRIGLALILAAMVATTASAHPHVFVNAGIGIVFDAKGRITYIRQVWQFDPGFSAFATQGLDANGDGKLSQRELAPLAKINIESLKPYHDFTWLMLDNKQIELKQPDKYFLRMYDGLLTLYLQIPLATPVRSGPKTTLEIYDPEYFVAFTIDKDVPIKLFNAPPGCVADYHPSHLLDTRVMAALAAVPMNQHDLPPGLQGAAAELANVINISCPK